MWVELTKAELADLIKQRINQFSWYEMSAAADLQAIIELVTILKIEIEKPTSKV